MKFVLLLIISIYSTVLPAQSWQLYADSAKTFAAEKKTDKAIHYYRLSQQQLPADSLPGITYWNISRNLGDLQVSSGQFKEGLETFLELKNIFEKKKDTHNTEYAFILYRAGLASFRLGRLQESEIYFRQSKELRGELLPHDHVDYTGSCIALANVYNTVGKYDEAEPLYLEAKEIIALKPGKETDNYARALNNLADLYKNRGEFEKAEPMAKEALAIRQRVIKKDSPNYFYVAVSSVNLANLYRDMGLYEKAEPLYREARQIRKEMGSGSLHDYAASCNILADLYLLMGEFKKAEALYVEAKDIRENFPPQQNSIDYAESCNNLASLYREQKDFPRSEQLMLQAHAIWKKQLEDADPTLGLNYMNLADLYADMGHYEKAESYYEQASTILEKVFGKEHLYYAQNSSGLARLYWNTGKIEKADALFRKAYAIQLAQLDKVFRFTSESEKQSFIRNITGSADLYQSFYLDRLPEKNNGQPYFISISGRNMVLNSLRQTREAINNSKDPQLLKQFDEWMGLKKQLANLYTRNNQQDQPLIQKLEEKATDLEKQLAKRSQVFRSAQQQSGWQEIRKALGEKEAAIEFTEFRYFNGQRWTDSVFYTALLIRKDQPEPLLIRLFEKKQLDTLLKLAGTKSDIRINALYKGDPNVGGSLYKLIWEPLANYLVGISTVYYSPAGSLYRVAFQAIPVKDSLFTNDQYRLVQLSTTARVVGLSKQYVSSRDKLRLYGGIEYTLDSIAWKKSVSKYQQRPSALSLPGDLARDEGFDYLPGTMTEVTEIKKIAQDAGLEVTIYSGLEASEESLKELTKENAPAVLHLATHGFYSKKPGKKMLEKTRLENMAVFEYAENPLLRSGLVMAGGQNSWAGKSIAGIEDGLLTAYEITALDLPVTRLAVLSACKSGLGDIEGAEGVYGLQRAFKIAGIQNLLMSLWEVNDRISAEFMQQFYRHLFNKESIEDAFHKTQEAMRNKYRNNPYNWAAWILVQ